MTVDEIRREIAAVEERMAKASQELALLRGLLDLHSVGHIATVCGNMQAESATKSKGAKIAANRSRDLTRSRLACIEAELSDPMIAAMFGCGRSTVQAWHSGTRPIPREFADKLSGKYPSIPTSVWKRIKG